MYLKFKKLHPLAIGPERANPSDAGLDVFFCPTDGPRGPSTVVLAPGENNLFPTGLSFEVPHGFVLKVCNRSGMAAKKCLVHGAHIIDPGYSGEVFIDLHNIGNHSAMVHPGDKIAQLLLVPVVHFIPEETVAVYENLSVMSNRGSGALGSTDKK